MTIGEISTTAVVVSASRGREEEEELEEKIWYVDLANDELNFSSALPAPLVSLEPIKKQKGNESDEQVK